MQRIRRPQVTAAVMVALFLIAIEATIVATAMPQIAASLGDLHLYAWVFSSFLLTQTATTVVFGKLADLYGRRPVLLAGLAVFTVGSLVCGTAHSMSALIAWRLVQGIGAGAIQPVAVTVVGDLYPAEERRRVQGWLASIWGASSLLGPLPGALIVARLGGPGCSGSTSPSVCSRAWASCCSCMRMFAPLRVAISMPRVRGCSRSPSRR